MFRRSFSFLVFLLMASPAWAGGADKAHRLTYQVYAGGFHAVEMSMDIDLNKSRYGVHVDAATTGFLHKLAPWRGSFATKGWVENNGTLKPEEHRSEAYWKEDSDIKLYRYGRDGSFKGLKVTENGEDKTPEGLTADITDQSTDILTATLSMLISATRTGKCAGSDEIFDGKRRFRLTYRPGGKAVLKPDKNAPFAGEALRCTAEVSPVAGDWGKKPRGWFNIQEQGRARGQLPTLWIAPLPDNPHIHVPVRIQVKTAYGVLMMHLVAAQ